MTCGPPLTSAVGVTSADGGRGGALPSSRSSSCARAACWVRADQRQDVEGSRVGGGLGHLVIGAGRGEQKGGGGREARRGRFRRTRGVPAAVRRRDGRGSGGGELRVRRSERGAPERRRGASAPARRFRRRAEKREGGRAMDVFVEKSSRFFKLIVGPSTRRNMDCGFYFLVC